MARPLEHAHRLLARAARLAAAGLDLGAGAPLEAPVWAELGPARTLRRIAEQAEADLGGPHRAGPGRPARY